MSKICFGVARAGVMNVAWFGGSAGSWIWSSIERYLCGLWKMMWGKDF